MSGLLQHLPSDIVRHLINDKGEGTLPSLNGAWPVFATKLPDVPDEALCVYDSESLLEGRTMTNGETQEHYGIQVRLRAVSPAIGYHKAHLLASRMDLNVLRDLVTLEGIPYLVHAITRRGGILPIGPESGSTIRVGFTINFTASIRQQ